MQMAQNLELAMDPTEFIMFWGVGRRGEGRRGGRIREGRDCVKCWRDGRGKRYDVVSSAQEKISVEAKGGTMG